MTLVKFLIGWPLSFVALYFLFQTFASRSGQLTLSTHFNLPSLIIAFMLFIAYYITRSYIWLLLLRYQKHQIPFRKSGYLWLSSQLKRYIPGNIWSFVGLAVSYAEHDVSKKDLAYAILIESELVIIATFILSLFVIPLLTTQFLSLPLSAMNLTFLLAVVFGSGAILYVVMGRLLEGKKGKLMTLLQHLFSSFTPQENVKLLLLMISAYVLYGLGYYFSINTVVPLNPTHLLTFFGMFIFSLVAGYLSVITPTGLGVREGFIALGLAKFIPLSVAGFSALFSRLVIILAELLTLFLSYLWYKAEKKWVRYEKLFSSHLHEGIVWVGIICYILYFTLASFLRYTEYFTGRFDLGNMAQTVWNTSQGRIFEITNPNGTEIISRLAFHADFILILLAPFYFLWADPRVLLLIQVLVVALGAWFIYKLGVLILQQKTLATVFALSYLLNPSVERANLYDFHAVVLATTFFLAACYFLLTKRYTFMIVFLLLAAITKEQVWFITALFGPILFIWHKKRLLGAVITAVSLSLFYYFLWYAIPQAAGASHFALSYFAEGGDSPSDIIKSILLSPVDSFQTATSPSRLIYYQKLLLPLGYLPLVFPFWLLLPLPDLVLNIFSDRSQLQDIYYQYTANITPFLYLAALHGAAFLSKRVPKLSANVIAFYLVIMTLSGSYLYGPLPGSKYPNIDIFTKPQANKATINRELKAIPATASVAASNNLASHLSERQRVYVVPRGISQADVIAIYKAANNTNSQDAKVLESVRSDTRYETYFENNEIVLFKRK